MKKLNFILLLSGLLSTILFLSFNYQKAEEDLFSLKTLSDQQYVSNNIEVEKVSEGLSFSIKKGEKGSISFLAEDDYFDVTSHLYLSIELENKSARKVRFEPVLIYDNPRKKYLKKKKGIRNEHIGFIEVGENLIFNCTMIRDNVTKEDYTYADDFPGMKGLPGGVILNFSGVDAKHIKKVNIEFPSEDFDRSVIVKRVFKNEAAVPSLYTKNKDKFFPFINEYGQYKHTNWKGKITNDGQFKDALIKEEKDLAAHKGSDEWDDFGGFISSEKYEATGHYRTQKINNKWWIITPEGHLFWSTGINGAGKLEVLTPTKGREHFFENLPAKSDPLYKGNSYAFGRSNMYKKYGENSEFKYTEVALKRMRSWGLNTLGGWSASNINEYQKEVKLPYTLIIHETSPSIKDKFPDVYNPKWKTNLEEKVKKTVEGKANDPYLFGVFINNEIHWNHPMAFAVAVLSKPKGNHGKKAFVNYLKEELKTINAFNKLAQTDFESWEALLNQKVNKKEIKWVNIKEYTAGHYRNMCEVYFKTSKEVLAKYAPGKMYIGCRWHGNHKNTINTSVGAKYLDILSFNAYENEVEFYPHPIQSIDKPFIISEFNFGALDTGKFFTGLGYASSQRNRGEKYVNFIEGALRNNRCVGAHWFMWANSTTAGKNNGENANCGVVSATDQPYYELINYMRKVNYNIYGYRLEQEM